MGFCHLSGWICHIDQNRKRSVANGVAEPHLRERRENLILSSQLGMTRSYSEPVLSSFEPSYTWSRPRLKQSLFCARRSDTRGAFIRGDRSRLGRCERLVRRASSGLAFGELFRRFDTAVTCSATCEQFRRSAIPHALIICAAFGDLCGTAPPKKN